MLKAALVFLRAMLISKARLAIENLALRQQLAVCRQSAKRPKLRARDRIFWICLSKHWSSWRSVLTIVQVRNGHQVVPIGIQDVLAVEIENRESRPPVRKPRDSESDPTDVSGEPNLGRTSNFLRAAIVGL